MIVSLLALIMAFVALLRGSAPRSSGAVGAVTPSTTLERTLKEGVLRVGVGGFPPYSIIDPSKTDPQERYSGFVIDMVREIAARHDPKLRVEFVQANFETMKSELDQGRYDAVVDPIYQTVTRGGDFGFTDPFTYTGVAVAVVRAGETRFKTFADLDQPSVTVALAVGWTSTEFAKQHLTKAKFLDVTVTGSPFEQLDAVAAGRADAALQDTPSAAQYVAAHPGKVKALWLDNPPSFVAAGFLTRRDDMQYTRFLSNAITVLRVDGTLERLDQKWHTYGYFEKRALEPGAGLRQR
jgi:ABC-type amino acid transport substrate-binding protein